jgi:sigma-B regulation protein RsbU (phosphoserine phosphatase)
MRSTSSSAQLGEGVERAAYHRAACGLLTTDRSGQIVGVNNTLLDWIGYTRDEVVGRSFVDLLTGGGRLYHETHYAPLLSMQGSAREIALDLVRRDGSRFPALVNARLDSRPEGDVVQVAVFDATERRAYERELMAAKERAEHSEGQARLLARTLQDTLIPHEVPVISGLDVAAVYLPAGEGHEIGGDFYDVFQVGHDDWVIAIGDVEGKGVEAAVVTALVRYTIRAASVEHGPSGVLRIVNDVLLMDQRDRYCTVLLMRCRRDGGKWTTTIAAGGHPLPILAGGGTAGVVGHPGSLLGVFDDVKHEEVVVRLEPSQVLLAYTDGVTEARRGREFVGEDRVASLAERLSASTSQAILDALVAEALRFGGTPNLDDIAAIAIKLAGS